MYYVIQVLDQWCQYKDKTRGNGSVLYEKHELLQRMNDTTGI
jgi:hypothetical protein